MFDDNTSTDDGGKKELFTKYIIPGLGIIAVLSIVFAGSLYLATNYTDLLGDRTETEQTSQLSAEDVQKLVNKVNELILLPEGETPNVATVNDLTQVQSQDFFKNAQVGDKVLIYASAKKAYLYRPDTHKLIEVGIVDQGSANQAVGGAQDSAPQVITPTPLPTIPPVLDTESTPTPEASPSPSTEAADELSPSPTLTP